MLKGHFKERIDTHPHPQQNRIKTLDFIKLNPINPELDEHYLLEQFIAKLERKIYVPFFTDLAYSSLAIQSFTYFSFIFS